MFSASSGTEFQNRKESRAATSWLLSLYSEPSVSYAISGIMMNEGDARNAYRMDSATSLGVPAGVRPERTA